MKRLCLIVSLMIVLFGSVLVLDTYRATLTVQAQAEPHAQAAQLKTYLPFISLSVPTPTPTPPSRIKARSGIHMGNRGIGTDWPITAFQLITGTVQGIFPAATVVQSSQLFNFHRSTSAPCRIDYVKEVRAQHLYDYLNMAIQHGTMVVIRITPSPGNFTDYNDLGNHHILLIDASLPGADYCDPKNAEKFRDILDIANEMEAVYTWFMKQTWFTQQGGHQNQLYFEPANEPNQEWYTESARKASDHGKTLMPNADNKDAWIAMDDYFANLYQLAKQRKPPLLILAPPMAQELYGETFQLETCNRQSVHVEGDPNSIKTGYDFMEKTYDGGTFDGYSWHNYWQETHEQWEGQDIENNCTSPVRPTMPVNDHVYEYFPRWMQQNITWSLKPRFITEAD
ncbi:MAG: hypothetical protein NT075_01355, partial [Chloroflexi bacterium]|nr:hypothetical protein [Chloroflexota bacterium]